ncbi:calcium/proton exchanger [Oceanirhabdus seepicola]|uniref:Ca(2+)/H(+) antiporter n=1 Tax=Oceanirhabdus seepicola TaxID=2828781 RepID=A0A9J6P479_9CLOT|nr:calcium/proton exchanger [Oceanirhabdus seepicola]MCM1990392.1 calcium/proton exchanger [Oceanirhabdus seepicola]
MSLIFLSIQNITGVIFYSILIIVLAFLLGKSTNNLSDMLGYKIGGLIGATLGNLPELIMGIWALRYGMIHMARGALMGSIISNMLLGLGIAVVLGGVKYKEQRFNKIIARTNFNMLFMAMIFLGILAALKGYGNISLNIEQSISTQVAMVMLGVYLLGLVFSLITHRNNFVLSEDGEQIEKSPKGNILKMIIKLFLISISLYFVSEKLIGNLKIVVESYNISEGFMGIILIPLLGNIGENTSAIMGALRNKVNLSLETAIGSSIQMALFVTPIMVIVSVFIGINLTLFFSVFHVIMIGAAVGISYFVFQDGKTYWFEGIILISTYIIITLAYYYLP